MLDQQRFLEYRAALMNRLEMSRDMSDGEILDLIEVCLPLCLARITGEWR